MRQYSCIRCGEDCYSADPTKRLCAECERLQSNREEVRLEVGSVKLSSDKDVKESLGCAILKAFFSLQEGK